MSLFKWQLYAAQGMKSKWYSFMGDDFMEESDDDQDSIKVKKSFDEFIGLLNGMSNFHLF